MRIGITCYPTYGGCGIVATELGHELAARGHEIHFISYAPPIRLDLAMDRIHYHEVDVTNYPLFQFPPYAWRWPRAWPRSRSGTASTSCTSTTPFPTRFRRCSRAK
jgi:glycosyltransferase involved in cell wall biosynthesis